MAVPSAKDRKYDRQLRLWASSGQEALENAHVCLIGATAIGSETVKNLVLPGIGKLMVIDDTVVGEDDLSSNFFVDDTHKGSSRAQAVESLVKELNPDVQTSSLDSSLGQLLKDQDEAFWNQFSIIIACEVNNQEELKKLNDITFQNDTALMVADCVGFYGTIRVSKRQHTIVETHPDSLVELRLTSPFQELTDFAQTFDLEKLEGSDLAHVPYVVILLVYLENFKKEHDGNLPATYKEKKELQQKISKFAYTMEDGQNFEEAAGAVLRTIQPATIPSSTLALCERADKLDKDCDTFWVLVAALKQFIADHNSLPQPGVLPDMKADTNSYIKLQNIYRKQAKQDAVEMQENVQKIISETGHEPIPFEVVETFCKNAKYIRILDGTKLGSFDVANLSMELSEDGSLVHQYVALMAYKLFVTQHGRVPGITSTDDDLTSQAKQILVSEPVPAATSKALAEIVRAGGAELHNIAALMGGVGAQEAIKLLTHQYGAMSNTVVYDGIQCTTEVFKL